MLQGNAIVPGHGFGLELIERRRSSSPLVRILLSRSCHAWKHADLLAYHALLFAHHHVPVHTIIVLLRPEAAHSNLSGWRILATSSLRHDMIEDSTCSTRLPIARLFLPSIFLSSAVFPSFACAGTEARRFYHAVGEAKARRPALMAMPGERA
jgi:hypothetical protein